MKPEIWLRTNRRILWAGALIPGILFVLCAGWMWFAREGIFFWVGVVIAAGFLALSLVAVWLTRRPRLAYLHGELIVYLGGWRPIHVPIDVVECFFLGQGATGLPKAAVGDDESRVATKTIVVRLAEAAHEWKHRAVRPSLGLWCENYITILGTWCEPISGEVVMRLNRRLIEVQRERRDARQT